MTIGVIVRSGARAEEALRAAVGLTLAGDRVICALIGDATSALDAPSGSQTRRHIDTLRLLGHEVGTSLARAAEADKLEAWT